MRKKEIQHFNTEILLGTISIVLFIIAAILMSSIFDIGGAGSNTLLSGLKNTIGVFVYVTPLVLLYSAFTLWSGKSFRVRPTLALGLLVSLASLLGMLSIVDTKLAGTLGYLVSAPLIIAIGALPAMLAMLGGIYVGAMIITGEKNIFAPLLRFLNIDLSRNKNDGDEQNEDDEESVQDNSSKQNIFARSFGFVFKTVPATFGSLLNIVALDRIDLDKNKKLSVKNLEAENDEQEEEVASDDLRSKMLSSNKPKEKIQKQITEELEEEISEPKQTQNKAKHFDLEFVAPPVDLLNVDSGRSNGGDTKSKGKTIQNTLAEFSIPVEISGVTVGPTVTQFRVKTPQGFKVRDIMKYHDNLQMNLAAESIHIDAPIPGQSVVGIDVPNKDKQMLGLGTLIDTPEFKNSNNLTVVMGKDIVGKPVYGDIESMPHLLIAGATKSGKSVTIQNIITSLLYKNSPEDLKLIIIDPKKVEFTVYKNLPHLYTPVITDAKNAIKCLNWAVTEMDRRYDYFADNYEGIQNITDYNSKILYPAIEKERRKKNPDFESLPEKFPFIVIIFDEFNDFMLNYGKEITSLITSLTQKARAAGMHLVLATQRPDVKVINGTIKANIPARIALRTSSRIDSQTILDQGGAEDLLGNGDMLFLNPGKKPQRVQAPFVSSDEVKTVIRYIKDRYYGYEAPLIDYTKAKDSITNGEIGVGGNNYNETSGDDEEEQLYNNAKEYIIMTGRASATNLQSKFGLGFAKANRMIMMLEERGVVSALEGNKRKVLIGREDVNENKQDTVEDLF